MVCWKLTIPNLVRETFRVKGKELQAPDFRCFVQQLSLKKEAVAVN